MSRANKGNRVSSFVAKTREPKSKKRRTTLAGSTSASRLMLATERSAPRYLMVNFRHQVEPPRSHPLGRRMAERPGKFGEALGPIENAVPQSRASDGRRGRSCRVAVVQTLGGREPG